MMRFEKNDVGFFIQNTIQYINFILFIIQICYVTNKTYSMCWAIERVNVTNTTKVKYTS